ncbi:MFS transporter prlL [Colletotrichum spaethianum]|uniref:MFS transporter prlL n=1 Tax=Colletotrichum spaethianum TaxID=700344 RepID=A0AA37PG34_9PEZI|nr:MFS transporter prlL [Colletotrichum spaethianum]GKT51666.1 MFS transporter prlL [Colletotrichum spaethianum]
MATPSEITIPAQSWPNSSEASKDGLTFAPRGEQVDETTIDSDVSGYDAELMQARSLLTTEEERKLMRRVDLRIMTICSLLFLMKNIDADNISNARIMNKGTPRNIMTQLNMTSDEYNLLNVLYYLIAEVPYIVLEAPSNLLLKRLRPSAWQSRIMISWGIALLCHVPVTNKGGIYATRFLLGVVLKACQGGNVPPTAKWLTEKEKAFIQARLPSNAPRAEEMNFNFSEIVDSLKDCRLWLFTLIWATFTVGTSGVRFYQPTVIANLGFTTIARAQLLNLPISLLAIFVIGITGFFADKGLIPRPLYPLGVFAVILACYGVMVAYPSNGAVYVATLIGNAFTASFFPLMWPWRVQTTSRATGSAFSIGFVNSYGQIGGAIGPQIFRSKYAPRYQTSFAAAMALVGCCTITTLITWWVTRKSESDTRRLKRARVRAEREGLAVLDDVVDRDLNNKRSDD